MLEGKRDKKLEAGWLSASNRYIKPPKVFIWSFLSQIDIAEHFFALNHLYDNPKKFFRDFRGYRFSKLLS